MRISGLMNRYDKIKYLSNQIERHKNNIIRLRRKISDQAKEIEKFRTAISQIENIVDDM